MRCLRSGFREGKRIGRAPDGGAISGRRREFLLGPGGPRSGRPKVDRPG